MGIPVFYCITFLRKIKEFFSTKSHFFEKNFYPAHRRGQYKRQMPDRHSPELRYRTEKGRKHAEIEDRAAAGTCGGITAHHAGGAVQDKRRPGGGQGESVQQVKQTGKAGQDAPERTEQVIENSRGNSQQNGPGKQKHLLWNHNAHGQPNRRLKNPPRSGAASS